MSAAPDQDVTELLAQAGAGDSTAASRLMTLVYEELRGVAGGYLRGQRAGHTLQPTALVHEAFLKLTDKTNPRWNDRAHFFALAARAMRQILIDHARGKDAAKRGGGGGEGAWRRVTLDVAVAPSGHTDIDVLALDESLETLARLDPRQAQIVEMRFFGGLTVQEAADVLGVSVPTVELDWRMARAWLSRRLGGDAGQGKPRGAMP
jgi:RNA polymerase sigma-70 factor (ECF subfamily)